MNTTADTVKSQICKLKKRIKQDILEDVNLRNKLIEIILDYLSSKFLLQN